ncbi:restriction endonuclease subunit S [Veillonella agrestimuris]|uniref:restriction endonuclease subunit S n=1 Tax=Veillonella agrestimuris TaxID=2941340 RepID=UPI0020412FB2|nr:restriction endonuclease subunit S [Veillonella agrestimuris]
MSEEKRKVPKLRFPGFTEDWKQCKLGEVLLDVKSGLSRELSQQDIGLPVVRANNIEDGRLNLNDNLKYWYKKDPQGAKTELYHLNQYDILVNFINSESKMGTAAYVENPPKRETIFTTNILRCRTKNNIDSKFVYYIMMTLRYKHFIKMITKPAVNQSSFTTVDFKKYILNMPDIEEQKNISAFLSKLDNYITLHQRKLENLKNLKKGLLQKLFPKNGETTPELRFPGFTDDWKQCKLGEVMEVTSVKRVHQSDWKNIGIRFLRARDIVAEYKNEELNDYLYIDKELYEKHTEFSGKVENGDLLVTGVGTIGIPKLIKTDDPLYFKDGNIIWFKNKNIINGNFFYYLFHSQTVQNFIRKSSGTGTVGTYTIENGKLTPIILPSNKMEQKTIGNMFVICDNLITLHQRKLEHLQLQKKALLQQMFV